MIYQHVGNHVLGIFSLVLEDWDVKPTCSKSCAGKCL